MNPALLFLLDFLPRVPSYIEAGAELVAVLNHGADKAKQLETENRAANDTDWAEVNSSIAAKRERLHG